MSGFRANGVVALLTDFGLRDPFVGLMKAAILARAPQARIVDLTHELPPFRPAAGAFWLAQAARWCPAGTVHVAVVDPGVGTERRLLVAVADGRAFLGPDNGLLGAALGSAPTAVHAIDLERLADLGLARPSATFHGRDVLAPVAAELAAGRVAPESLGPSVSTWQAAAIPGPVARAGGWDGEVLLLDRYGNAFTSLPGELLRTCARPVVTAAGHRVPVVRTYGDAPAGTAVALENSFGVVEVAVVTGDAGSTLGLGPGTPVRLEPE